MQNSPVHAFAVTQITDRPSGVFPALAPFVKGFGVYMSTNALQLCTCSFGSSLHMDFTSALESTEVQRRFFAFLVSDGVDVEIRSSEFSQEVSKPCSDAQAAV